MALARSRRGHRHIDYWPGFVDALSVMLLVITFLLSVFMLSQFFMSREVTGKDTALSRLNRQIEELTSLLALERSKASTDQSSLSSLQATLDATSKERERLQGTLDAGVLAGATTDNRMAAANALLTKEKDVSGRAIAQVDILNQQISALRKQLAALEDALGASESRDKESQARIAELGSRLM